MIAPAHVLVLVGPKGSGKTTLGKLLERPPVVRFLEVEPIAARVLADMGGVIDEDYARRAFDAIVAEIDAIDRAHRVIVIETTGASDETPRFLAQLHQRHEVRLVRVRADAETCAARIAARDPARQIAVSRELVREMHARIGASARGANRVGLSDARSTRGRRGARPNQLLRWRASPRALGV